MTRDSSLSTESVPRRPVIIRETAALRIEVSAARAEGRRIGLVPTMGALHEGHLSLVDASRRENDLTIVSIYVNPTQFGHGEDFSRYPRDLDADLEALEQRGAQIAFCPAGEVIYPVGFSTYVDVGDVAVPLEGEHRPGHFRGVATVVLKLLNLVQPDAAYFGQKDFQQTAVIRRLVRDLNVPVEIVSCPIVREPDGLALSSRNVYLSSAHRQEALVLSRSLETARELFAQGERSAAAILSQMLSLYEQTTEARIDYVAIVDPESFRPIERIDQVALAAVAVHFGDTRLIDNCLLGAGG